MKSFITIRPDLEGKEEAELAERVALKGLPEDCVVIYRGRNIVAQEPKRGLMIKDFKVPGFIKSIIYGWFRAPKCRRAYSNALRLAELGIGTPAPTFSIECYKPLRRLSKSYYACEALVGWSTLRGIEKESDFKEIAEALAEFIYNIHARKVLMKDMSPGNILYRRKCAGSYEFSLVDINRMEFDKDWKAMNINFRALLDTEEATLEIARHYKEIRELHGVPVPADFVERVGRWYRDFYDSAMRRRRFKKLLHL